MARAPGRSSNQSRGGARSRPNQRPSGKAAADRRQGRPKGSGSTGSRLLTDARDHLSERSDDVWGVGLIAAGILTGLAIHLGAAGPAGQALDDLASFAVGASRVFLPLMLVVLGVALVKGEPAASGRTTVGFGGLALSGTGLLHLARGGPGIGGDLDAVRDGGGVIGAVFGGTLRAVLAPTGASVVLVAVAVVALLVLARTSLRDVAAGVSAASRPPLAWLREAIGALGRLDGERPDDEAADEPAPVKRRSRKAETTVADEPTADDDGRLDPVIEANGVRLYDQDASAAPDTPAEVPEPPPVPVEAADDGEVDPTGDATVAEAPLAPAPAWKLPSDRLLSSAGVQEIDERLVKQGGATLERALEAHGVDARLVGMTVGPTVTRYELELAEGVKVNKVINLHRDIAYAMASPDVRILAPIPGRSAIGVEVPNRERHTVALGDILESAEARRATHPLEVGLGRDISGRSVMLNLATTPHILIAGATGAGKSSCINTLITSLMMRTTPDDVRLILVDPKRVELGQYNGLPHLITQVVVDPKKAANALQWAVKEMERRYDLLSSVGFRDIGGYNQAFDAGQLADDPIAGVSYQRLPFLVVVVDELADLMMVAARDVEASITRIAQMARAVGIHLVIATQRPSVNVITGVIKANIPCRLAFAVSSGTDSKVILDQPGAERLIGRGDMLLLTPSSSQPRRIQGSWVEEDEVRRVVAHWRRQAPSVALDEGVQIGEDPSGTEPMFDPVTGGSGDEDDGDEKLWEAMEAVVRSGLGSTSMLQRKLGVGFARAGRIMDLLEQRGVVGPSIGPKAREVLMTVEEFDELRGVRSG